MIQKIDFFYTGKPEANQAQSEENLSCTIHTEANPNSAKSLKDIVFGTKEDYFILFTKPCLPVLGLFALDRMIQVAEDSGAGMVYTDYFELKDGSRKTHPLCDYQTGSIRDDFDFGPLLLIRTDAAKKALQKENTDYNYAALYDLRLKISQDYPLVHLNEYLYTLEENDVRNSDEKMFAYVDPKNRAVQLEMEQSCTEHLKAIGAWLKPVFEKINLNEGSFLGRVGCVHAGDGAQGILCRTTGLQPRARRHVGGGRTLGRRQPSPFFQPSTARVAGALQGLGPRRHSPQ